MSEGIWQNEVASAIRDAPSTVKREIDRFGEEIESRGLQQAAEKYGVSEPVEELHDIAAEIRKNNLT